MNLDPSLFEKVLEDLHDGVYIVDCDRKILFWNKAAERITGFRAEEVVGKHCYDNLINHIDKDGNRLCMGLCPLADTIADGKRRTAEIFLHHKGGHRIPVSVRATRLTDPEGNVIGGIELFSDAGHQKVHTLRIRELEKLALLDPLTQLANRTYLEREIQSWLEEYKRMKIPFGILFMDADHFKKLNDTHGHSAGDEVLKSIAATFTANSRPFDRFGRWGGEEFIGMIRYADTDGLEQIGNRIRTLVEHSFLTHGDQQITVTISIGATLVRENDTPESLVQRADELMYQSKTAGRNRLTLG